MHGKTEPEHATTETALARCFVEGDPATKARDLRRRRKALGISFAIESMVLALLIVAPLMTSVAQPHFAGTEVIRFVFGGSPNHTPVTQRQPGNHHSPALGDHRIKFTPNQAPPRPLQTVEVRDDAGNSDPYTSIDMFPPSGSLISDLQPRDQFVPPPPEIRSSEA